MLHRRLTSSLLLVALLAVPALATAAPPPAPPAPMDTLKAKETELRTLLATPTGPGRTTQLKALADTVLDYGELARQSLGPRAWSKRTPAEQAEFQKLLQALIEKNYVEQAERDPEFRVQWQQQELGRKGDRARVVTLAASKSAEIELEYRLMLTERGWIVYNLLIDGVSMTRNYRKTFKRIIRRQGFPKLIERMQRKLAGAVDAEIDDAGRAPKDAGPASKADEDTED